MNALMLHTNNDGTADFRIWRPAKGLQKLGVNVRRLNNDSKEHPVPKSDKTNEHYNPAFGTWEEAGDWTDVTLSQRADNPLSVSLMFGLRDCYKKPLIAEMDDDYWHLPTFNQSYKEFEYLSLEETHMRVKSSDIASVKKDGVTVITDHQGRHWVPLKKHDARDWSERFIKNCDALIVSTPELKATYKSMNEHIYVIKNMIDFELIACPEDNMVKKEPKKIRVGWFGSFTHYDDLKVIDHVIRWMLKTYPQVEFYCIGMVPDFWEDLEKEYPKTFVRIMGVKPEFWHEYLTSMDLDIGLAPLVDIPFNACKSEVKWMEYAARKIPCIASPIAPYKRAIEHGKTGFLCTNNEKEWKQVLTDLISKKELRLQIGQNAYDKCYMEYNMDKQSVEYLKVFEEVKRDFDTKPFRPVFSTVVTSF